ncbi:MAG: hypothetical protein AB9921_08075 [Erysipelotrichaceae bacterium]
MKLSKREQFLLFIMGLLAISIFFFALIFLPMSSKIDALKAEKSTLEQEKTIIDATLPTAPGLKKQLETKDIEVNAELAKIESPLLSAEFERWILPLTTKYDMRVLGATFSEPVVSMPTSMVTLVFEPIYGLRTMIDDYVGNEVPIDSAAGTESELLKSHYTYSLLTNYTRFKQMIDDIAEWDTTFFITEASYNFSTGVANLTIDAYSIHKISYEGDQEYPGDYDATGDNSSGGSPGYVDGIDPMK